ncbi:hypothetical protein KIN20_009153 [Parelaphostrongylus tenuis]|uniref:Uncharacterized protein n=1 Tax=Parelaphostrongylus tenuis TaxID=148309 RepID=A0AAD5QKG6_PARTN|nr:hypothetical protein KIN20_009153 [Parelaphostrongylus tenuis]
MLRNEQPDPTDYAKAFRLHWMSLKKVMEALRKLIPLTIKSLRMMVESQQVVQRPSRRRLKWQRSEMKRMIRHCHWY